MKEEFEINELESSQEPAVQLLVAMGYEYLSPAETLKQRKGRGSNVLLEGVLEEKLKELNRIHHKGQEYLFSEENIQTAIQKLKNIKYDGLVRTNEVVYDLITLGTALEQTVEGDSKSFNLNYIDWKTPSRNSYHVTVEYGVENYRKSGYTRPDIVLFINGIPFCVIECKAPQVEVEQAVSQMIRNQGDEHIPQLFTYSQLVIAVNKNEAKYATTGTLSKFWSIWKEEEDTELATLVNEGLHYQLVKEDGYELTKLNSPTAPSGEAASRLVTDQDRAIYALCRPERLIELAWKFTVYDGGDKKVARYQQYFVIKSTLERVKEYEDLAEDSRKGGVIWHTQGSGKSLTMVMLTRNLALDSELKNPRIVLVTDRDDLDRQLGNTFTACGLEAKRATSGKNLLDLVARQSASIITTIINKFEGAMKLGKTSDDSANIFVLVDEGHRTQFGTYAARMRQVFPNASYLGFTGTPLVKKDKNNFKKFGQLIEPYYSILQAVEDGAVVPLLYEGRHVELEQDQKAIDKWFERHTSGLSKEQKADLKRKYARAEMLNKADKVIYERSFDISEHFRKSWQETGFKAQLVAPSKLAALKYHEYLEELGIVSSAVIISPPDMREGHEEVGDEPTDEVVKFWKKMMNRYGRESEYTKQVIGQFKKSDDPEILIVVDKLLTGFDAPRNTVLYLCRKLKEHTLLQAIARVNRLHENKEFGYIVDYVNILEELDQSLTMYGAFEGFDEEDLRGSLTSIQTEVEKLPDSYSALWEIFKTVRTSYDTEAYELLLADEEIREEFYVRLSDFAKKLSIALSSERFLNEVETDTLERYKRDLRTFHKLKLAVKQRYAEAVDYKEYEPKIKKLLDTHIMADEAIQLNEPVNIFDNEAFTQVKEDQEVYSTQPTSGAKADTIAHNTKRVISENYDKDPSFYDKFSKLIQQAIDDFRAKRISDLEYLDKSRVYSDQVNGSIREDLPASLRHREEAAAYYGVLLQMIDAENAEEISAETGIKVEEIFQKRFKVGFWADPDAVNLVENDIEDFLYETVRDVYGIKLSGEEMGNFIKDALKIAKSRTSSC